MTRLRLFIVVLFAVLICWVAIALVAILRSKERLHAQPTSESASTSPPLPGAEGVASEPEPDPDPEDPPETPPAPPQPSRTYVDTVGREIVERKPVPWQTMSRDVPVSPPSRVEALRRYIHKSMGEDAGFDAACLGNLIKAAGLMRLRSVEVMAWLGKLSGDRDSMTAARARVAICLCLPSEAKALVPPLFTHHDPGVRAMACEVAPFFKTEPWIQGPMEGAVEDEDATVRVAALKHLPLMERFSPELIETVIRMAGAEKGPVRALCVTLFGLWGTETCYREVLGASRSESPDVREAAARALGIYDKPQSAGALVRLLEDPSQAVRVSAITSLGQIGGKETSAKVAEKLGDPGEKVRLAALKTLQFHPPPDLPKAAWALLADESPGVRYALVALLGEYGTGEADELLAALLDDGDAGVGGRTLREVSNRITRSMADALLKKLETKGVNHPDRYLKAMEELAGRKPWKDGEGAAMTGGQKVDAWKAWWKTHGVREKKLR